ncbi:MAG: hypothetical protein JWN94_1135 [Betaproteobacteria bacterium]|nr:hypothetical protein [Betaproteobacteria bacterium]
MKTITRFTQIFMFLLAAASSPPTVAAETGLVVWSLGSGVNLFYPETPTPIGVATGTFTYALGGGPTDWNIQTPAFPPIINLFFGLPGQTLTPANSSSAGSISTVFRLSIPSFNTFMFEVEAESSSVVIPFNQPGSMVPLVVAHYASGIAALSNNGFGSGAQTPIIGVLAVPEPQTYAMLALGLGVLVLVRRRTPTTA